MEPPPANQIVMPGGPTFEVCEADTPRTNLCRWPKISTAVESECASVRIDGHPRTKPPVRASPARRLKSRAGCGSRDRWDLKRRENTRREPAAHPRTVSTNQSAAVLQRPRLSGGGRPTL